MRKPNWLKYAVATRTGYWTPDLKEKLKSQRLTQEQIDAWNGVPVAVEDTAEKADITVPVQESVGDQVDYNSMTKDQLEALGRVHGIELDKRLKKDTLIEQLTEALSAEKAVEKTEE